MIITTCSKFGTRACEAAAGSVAGSAGEGREVGRTGVGTNVGERTGDGFTVGGALVVQEIKSTKRRRFRPRRFI
jgi:hypothetical protein